MKQSPIFLITNLLNQNRSSIPIQVNVTELASNTTNCVNEIRVIHSSAQVHTLLPSEIINGDDSRSVE